MFLLWPNALFEIFIGKTKIVEKIRPGKKNNKQQQQRRRPHSTLLHLQFHFSKIKIH